MAVTCLRCRAIVVDADHVCVDKLQAPAVKQGTPLKVDPLASKKAVLLQFMQLGIAQIHVDARVTGVAVPEQFKTESNLRLNYSFRYKIPDLAIDEAGIVATLSFARLPFKCTVPWAAIYCISSHVTGKARLWIEDLPPEMSAQSSARGPKS